MKTLTIFFSFTIFTIMLFVSCENKTELTQSYISGSIDSYDPTSFDSILCIDYKIDSVTLSMTNLHKVGKCNISTNGDFSAGLNEPFNTYAILSRINRKLVISDTTAIIGYLTLKAYRKGNVVGSIIKCSKEYLIYPLENNHSSWMYTNKNVTIEGIENFGTINSMIYTKIYHLNLKKGWNEVVYTHNVTMIPYSTVNIEVTNTTTENLKWRFTMYNYGDILSTIKKQSY